MLSGELIENAIKSGRIDAGGSSSQRRSTHGKKDNEVNSAGIYNVNYSKPVTVTQPAATGTYSSSNQDFSQRKNFEKKEFTQLPMTYGELHKELYDKRLVSPFLSSADATPFPEMV